VTLELGEVLEQAGGALAPVGRGGRQAQLGDQECEEARVAQGLPSAAAVEGGKGDQEVGHGGLFRAEEELERIAALPCFQEFEGRGGRTMEGGRGRGRGRVRV
jgi:hypothetical protein